MTMGSAARAVVDRLRAQRSLANVERFCFFLGYARSGSTLVGALLNAHPEIVVANELDALYYIQLGLPRNKIFSMLLEHERQFAVAGYRWTGYDYAVPGQYQGTFERLRVIGDKRAGRSAHQLGDDPELLGRVRRTVGVPIRVIHVVRNPYDNVVTMARRGGSELGDAVENYRRLSTQVDEVRARLQPEELLDLRYESFAEHPEHHLAEVCRFLGVSASADYLEACAPLVTRSGSRSRNTLSWSTSQRRQIEMLVEQRPVLTGYAFDQ
jgi:hypothetical protein